MSEELMITKDDLVNWLNRPPSNDDLDLIGFITTRLENFYKLEQENKQLKEEKARLKEINEKVYKYLDEKKDVPEWWDTDFMICMDMLKGGNRNLIEILGDKENG